jgi:hypothetical protein
MWRPAIRGVGHKEVGSHVRDLTKYLLIRKNKPGNDGLHKCSFLQKNSGATRTLGSLLRSEILAAFERRCCDLRDRQEGRCDVCRARIALARASISMAWVSRPVCRSKTA